MNDIRGLFIILIFFSGICAPVMADPQEEDILSQVQNLSVTMPTYSPAVLGTQESMLGYSAYLVDSMNTIISLSNQVLVIFGQDELSWQTPGNIGITKKSAVSAPATPGVTLTAPTMAGSPGLVTIQTITGTSGHQTVNVPVSASYWELWYTIDPPVSSGVNVFGYTIGSQAMSGSPLLKIVVSNAAGGQVIKTIELPANLDATTWETSGDPRPWIYPFMGGNKEYSFDITAANVTTYGIEVRVPENS
jgi:hypothetical protein